MTLTLTFKLTACLKHSYKMNAGCMRSICMHIHPCVSCCRQTAQFICDVCGRQFQFQSSLQAHAGVHKDAFPYTCQICGKGFKVTTALYLIWPQFSSYALFDHNFHPTLCLVMIHQWSKSGSRVQVLRRITLLVYKMDKDRKLELSVWPSHWRQHSELFAEHTGSLWMHHHVKFAGL